MGVRFVRGCGGSGDSLLLFEVYTFWCDLPCFGLVCLCVFFCLFVCLFFVFFLSFKKF